MFLLDIVVRFTKNGAQWLIVAFLNRSGHNLCHLYVGSRVVLLGFYFFCLCERYSGAKEVRNLAAEGSEAPIFSSDLTVRQMIRYLHFRAAPQSNF